MEQGKPFQTFSVIAGTLTRQIIGARNDMRRRALLRSDQKAGTAQGDADAAQTSAPREENSKDKADDRRRHPGDQRWRDRKARDKGQHTESDMRAVAAHDILEGNGTIIAPLGVPAGVKTKHEMQDMARLNEHHDRREKSRHDDFEQSRCDEA